MGVCLLVLFWLNFSQNRTVFAHCMGKCPVLSLLSGKTIGDYTGVGRTKRYT